MGLAVQRHERTMVRLDDGHFENVFLPVYAVFLVESSETRCASKKHFESYGLLSKSLRLSSSGAAFVRSYEDRLRGYGMDNRPAFLAHF